MVVHIPVSPALLVAVHYTAALATHSLGALKVVVPASLPDPALVGRVNVSVARRAHAPDSSLRLLQNVARTSSLGAGRRVGPASLPVTAARISACVPEIGQRCTLPFCTGQLDFGGVPAVQDSSPSFAVRSACCFVCKGAVDWPPRDHAPPSPARQVGLKGSQGWHHWTVRMCRLYLGLRGVELPAHALHALLIRSAAKRRREKAFLIRRDEQQLCARLQLGERARMLIMHQVGLRQGKVRRQQQRWDVALLCCALVPI